MISSPTNVAVLGSTGSIGRGTLDVIAASRGKIRVLAISAHRNLDMAMEQAHQFRPKWLVATDAERAGDFDWSNLPAETELRVGAEQIAEVVAEDEIDVVVAAIVGSAGLAGTWAGVQAGQANCPGEQRVAGGGGAADYSSCGRTQCRYFAGRQRTQRGFSGPGRRPPRGRASAHFDRQWRTVPPPLTGGT